MPKIVVGQLKLENQKALKANTLLFCDTNIVVTRVWSETHFECYCDPDILAYSEKFNYDLYLLTGIDVPWEKDDLRDRPNDRQYMFDYFKNTLDRLNKKYIILHGDPATRFQESISLIDSLLKK